MTAAGAKARREIRFQRSKSTTWLLAPNDKSNPTGDPFLPRESQQSEIGAVIVVATLPLFVQEVFTLFILHQPQVCGL
jgi:hypothetical protein